MGFKEDADFSRFLSMGVYAADHVSHDLDQRGHCIIELERYAKANKIWQVKVKRMRLPDLLCIRCGRRFESKGKTKLEVKLSDSTVPGREWFAGGMRPNDVFAFAEVDLNSAPPTVGSPVYVTRQSLESSYSSSKEGKRKSASQGMELDRTWPMWVPKEGGTVTERIGRKIRIKTNSGRAQTYNHGKNWVDFFALNVDDRFQSGFPVATSFALAEVECNGETWDWRSEINDSHDDIRFPAIKASRFHTIDEQVAASLLSVALDNANDWRVRVEALASLSWFDAKFIDHLKRWVISSKTKPDQQMEAVFALSEVGSSATQMALVEIANSVEVASDEVRAAAAWGLGTAGDIPVSHLLDLVGSENDLVALHAAAQLPSHMTTEMESRFTKWLAAGEHRLVSFAVHLADRLNDVPFLVKSLQRTTGNTRRVILLTLGDMPSDRTDGVLVNLSSSDRSVIETIQARRNDWLSAPERIGALDSLAIQSLRR